MTVAETEAEEEFGRGDEYVSVTPQGKLRFSARAAEVYLPKPIVAVSPDIDYTSTGEIGLRPEYEQWDNNHNVNRAHNSAQAEVSAGTILSIAGVETPPESGVRCPVERSSEDTNVILIDVSALAEANDE